MPEESAQEKRRQSAMRWKTKPTAFNAAAKRLATVALLGVPLTGCAAMTVAGDAGCASYAEARLTRPPAETVGAVPPAWANWIADLDDRMTGTCR